MGAGILPTTLYNNKVYFLFGKENKYEDSAPGFSDFGGGTDNTETYLETAVREAGEELTGFLGNSKDVRKMLTKCGTYNIDYVQDGHKTYRVHIFPYPYDISLVHYYNNNQKFLQKRLPPAVFKTTKIFEKAEIKWVCVDDLKRMRPKFRCYFQNIVDMILAQKNNIREFMLKCQSKGALQNRIKERTIRKSHTSRKTRRRHKS